MLNDKKIQVWNLKQLQGLRQNFKQVIVGKFQRQRCQFPTLVIKYGAEEYLNTQRKYMDNVKKALRKLVDPLVKARIIKPVLESKLTHETETANLSGKLMDYRDYAPVTKFIHEVQELNKIIYGLYGFPRQGMGLGVEIRLYKEVVEGKVCQEDAIYQIETQIQSVKYPKLGTVPSYSPQEVKKTLKTIEKLQSGINQTREIKSQMLGLTKKQALLKTLVDFSILQRIYFFCSQFKQSIKDVNILFGEYYINPQILLIEDEEELKMNLARHHFSKSKTVPALIKGANRDIFFTEEEIRREYKEEKLQELISQYSYFQRQPRTYIDELEEYKGRDREFAKLLERFIKLHNDFIRDVD